MNQFRKTYRNPVLILLLFTFIGLLGGVLETVAQNTNATASNEASPKFENGEMLYADIDPDNRKLFVVVSSGLWQYSLKTEQWTFLSDLEALPVDLYELEFAYNPEKETLEFWDRGVGRFYQVTPDSLKPERLDQSHHHRNQFKHQPFIRNGSLYAFGGYGYWFWKNYITYFDRNIKEWNVQNVDMNSPVPSARVPYTGIYVPSRNELFVYGGSVPSAVGRADGQFTSKKRVNDIWRYSFGQKKWKKLKGLNPQAEFYEVKSSIRVGRINNISNSAYSDSSNIWYIPSISEKVSNDLAYLMPINIRTKETGEFISIPAIEANQVMPTNFLFDTGSASLIIVGIKKITDGEEYPINVITVSEDSLLAEVTFGSGDESYALYYMLGILLLAGLIGAFYLKNISPKASNDSSLPLTDQKIAQIDWLKTDERILLKYLYRQQKYVESLKIDDAVWPDIDNYDYQRKLRNDTINSINKKFIKRFDSTGEIIVRKKDPNDKRRYLYGLNSDLVVFDG